MVVHQFMPAFVNVFAGNFMEGPQDIQSWPAAGAIEQLNADSTLRKLADQDGIISQIGLADFFADPGFELTHPSEKILVLRLQISDFRPKFELQFNLI